MTSCMERLIMPKSSWMMPQMSPPRFPICCVAFAMGMSLGRISRATLVRISMSG